MPFGTYYNTDLLNQSNSLASVYAKPNKLEKYIFFQLEKDILYMSMIEFVLKSFCLSNYWISLLVVPAIRNSWFLINFSRLISIIVICF